MFCKNCGKELSNTAKFCTDCGTPVQVNEESAETVASDSAESSQPVTDSSNQPVVDSSQPVTEKPKKAKKEKKGKKGLVITLVIVFVVIIAAVAGIAFYMSPGQQYKRAMKKGDDFMSEKAYSDAVICYENALDIQKSREAEKALVKAHIKYAEEFVKQSNYADAIDHFLEALDRDEDNKDAQEGLIGAYVGFGNQKLESKAYEEAEELFENALALDGGNDDAKAGRIGCYLGFGDKAADSGDYDKALTYYDEVLDWEDDNASAYCGKAHVTALQGDVFRAMELLEEGLEWNEDNSELLREREYLIENVIVTAKEMVWNDGSYSREEYNEEDICVKSESYDRKGALNYETAYDDKGNILWSKSYDGRGNVTSETTYEYDGMGNTLTCVYSSTDYPEESYRTEFEYDGNGNLVKQSSYSTSGQMTSLTIYEYDGDNRNTLYAYYYYYYESLEDETPSSSGWESIKYTYDDHGNTATRVYASGSEYGDGTNYENTYSESSVREYDADGNVTACTISDSYGGTDNTISTYDSQGNMLTSENYYVDEYGDTGYRNVTKYEYYADGTTSWYWNGEYDREDNLTEETEAFYDEEGKTVNYRYESNYNYNKYYSYNEYEYDEHNNTVKEICDSSYDYTVYEYENSYDAFGNLTNVYNKKYGTSYSYRYEYMLKK